MTMSNPMNKTFPAQFPGICSACGEHYSASTLITRSDYTYIHSNCDELIAPTLIEGPACSACWLRHPIGACDYD